MTVMQVHYTTLHYTHTGISFPTENRNWGEELAMWKNADGAEENQGSCSPYSADSHSCLQQLNKLNNIVRSNAERDGGNVKKFSF